MSADFDELGRFTLGSGSTRLQVVARELLWPELRDDDGNSVFYSIEVETTDYAGGRFSVNVHDQQSMRALKEFEASLARLHEGTTAEFRTCTGRIEFSIAEIVGKNGARPGDVAVHGFAPARRRPSGYRESESARHARESERARRSWGELEFQIVTGYAAVNEMWGDVRALLREAAN